MSMSDKAWMILSQLCRFDGAETGPSVKLRNSFQLGWGRGEQASISALERKGLVEETALDYYRPTAAGVVAYKAERQRRSRP